ncbi:hypothetical protein EDC04DRAFT_2576208, partial [Pisolithus marmoratus]
WFISKSEVCLTSQLHTITMDNATNCDILANELAILIPEFCGSASRTRCFPHTVNLIAKVKYCSNDNPLTKIVNRH